MFDYQTIQKILKSIEDMHIVFIGREIGVGVLSEQERQILTDFGFTDLPQEGKLDEMFRFGMLAESLGQENVRNMPLAKLKKYLLSGKILPLNEIEESALNSVKFQAYNDIKGLGNRTSKDFSQVFIEVDRKLRDKCEKVIQKQLEEAVLTRMTSKELASELRRVTGDVARNFERMADFLMHSALDTGIAVQIQKQYGSEAVVYKDVYNGACKQCVKAYLTSGIGSRPKLFKLREIIANGTNIGKPQDKWLPVIGPHHPWCRCTLQYKSTTQEWDDADRRFKLIRDDKGVKRVSQPKIQIQFNKK